LTLNCFVRKHAARILGTYVPRLHTDPRIEAGRLSEEAQNSLWRVLQSSFAKFPEEQHCFTEPVFNHPTLFLCLAEKALKYGANVLISQAVHLFVAQQWSGDDHFSCSRGEGALARAELMQQFVPFCLKVEACSSSGKALLLLFGDRAIYSPMKQTIQFCGDSLEIADAYAGQTGAVYKLALHGDHTQHQFIDLDDLENIRTLMAVESAPFHSGVTFDKGWVNFYGERRNAEIRKLVWSGLQERLQTWSDDGVTVTDLPLPLFVAPDMPDCLLVLDDLLPWLKDYQCAHPRTWSLLQRASCTSTRGQWHNQSLYDVLRLLASQDGITCHRPFYWSQELEDDSFNPTTERLQYLDDVVALGQLEVLASAKAINAKMAVIVNHQRLLEARCLKQMHWLNQHFGIKSLDMQRKLRRLESWANDDSDSESAADTADIWKEIASADLVADWLRHFESDLASPRGIWIYTHANRLLLPINDGDATHTRRGRTSHYIIDSLLVRILTTSALFRERKWRGWRCASMKEWMVYEPEQHATISTTGEDALGYHNNPKRPCHCHPLSHKRTRY